VNNYRDIDNDRRAGKKTLAVLIGKKPMLALYIILPLIAVCVTVFVSERNDVWTYCYIGFMSSFFGASFANILRIGEGRALNKVLGDTARNIFIYGLLTSLYIIL
jgi:1,4-dihydroxy-2-naphthoate octaprenyltransferase